MPRAFISYSTKDRPFVEQLARDLGSNDVEVWFDRWEMLPGDSLIQKIGDAILSHDYFVVVLSPQSVDSSWVNRELGVALNREFAQAQVSVIPCPLNDCKIPPFLQDKVYADFRGPYRNGLTDLMRTLNRTHQSEHLVTSVPSDRGQQVIWDNVVSNNLYTNNLMDEHGQK